MPDDIKNFSDIKPYSRWSIHVRIYDQRNTKMDDLHLRQDLYVDEKQFVVRVTRDADGVTARYEDRGTVDGDLIKGETGFGGKLEGQLLENNGVYLHGTGGHADMTRKLTRRSARPRWWTGILSPIDHPVWREAHIPQFAVRIGVTVCAWRFRWAAPSHRDDYGAVPISRSDALGEMLWNAASSSRRLPPPSP